MKRLIYFAFSAMLFASCAKDVQEYEVFSSAQFIHAAPNANAFDAYVDNVMQNSAIVSYRSPTSTYLGVSPGSRTVEFRNVTSAGTVTTYAKTTDNFESNKAYSYFLYDVLNASGQGRLLRLNDDLTLPAAGTAKIRFLHLAPNTPAVDLTVVRSTQFSDTTGGAANAMSRTVAVDSVTISNVNYVGATPNTSELEKFISIPGSAGTSATSQALGVSNVGEAFRNNRYTIKVKAAGTQNVLLQSAVTTLTTGRIYTIYITGLGTTASALNLNVFQNF